MNLHEYQAKELLKEYKLPIPKGYICYSVQDVKKIIKSSSEKDTSKEWVAKCQIHAGGRGLAGGIIQTDDQAAILAFAETWFGHCLVTAQTSKKGLPVNAILIERSEKIAKAFYLGATVDRSSQCIIIMASSNGGVHIEDIALRSPQCIHKVVLNPILGPNVHQGKLLASKLGLEHEELTQFVTLFLSVAKLFLRSDATLVEVNPLIVTPEKQFVCLDAKVTIDDNALYRQPKISLWQDISQENEREYLAAKHGFSYVLLDGTIGCMVNGAGLAMATMDVIKLYGAEPANFLDIGGATTEARVAIALKFILSDTNVKGVLVNVFGGIVRCDIIAKGIIAAIKEIDLAMPIVARFEGNNAEMARNILLKSQLNVISAVDLVDAMKKITGALMLS